MVLSNENIKKWVFAFLLALPVFYLYALHFFNHDALHHPTGIIQWEHMLYMCSAKEYAIGNAGLLYEWPIINDFGDNKVFFQPQIFVLGYLWKWLPIEPGYILTAFGFVFALLTLRTVISIIYLIIPTGKYKMLITMLFCWGGGFLSAAGILLNFVFFKGSFADIPRHIFFLDPAGGSWCLNFGRTLIYPLEAYYHFLFMSCILLALKRKFLPLFGIMLLLMLSHPYTAIESISIVLVWVVFEYCYFKNTQIKKAGLIYIATAFILYFIYYAIVLNGIPIYRKINEINALDWGYKAWHFVPAYAIVWLFSFIAIKNIPALKKHFSDPNNRLYFWWGTVAFLLSVHGFAFKPVQPIHFARGYVYAGFFLFSIPALQSVISYLQLRKKNSYVLLPAMIFVFLFDNITWFGMAALQKNNSGVYFNTAEKEVISFFENKHENGIAIGSLKNYYLNAGIQLYTSYKGWIPHPYLALDVDAKRSAVDSLLIKGKLDDHWKNKPVYLYCDKNDSTLQPRFNNPVFENSNYKIFKIN